MTGPSYGIDFGTTNSVVARAAGGRVDVVVLDDHVPPAWAGLGFDRTLPSVIGFTDRTPAFGWPVKLRTDRRLEAVKRLFATDDEVEIGGRRLRVEEAAAMFLRYLQCRAGAPDGAAPLDRAVITVPANSRGRARLRTRLAAAVAGIEVLALINEPTAAAMAHARTIGTDQRILVFDWGGGTLDVTVLEAFEGTFIEQASKGVQRLGGLDLDAAFMAALLPHLPGSADWTPAQRTAFRLDLELAKVRLSTTDTTDVPLPTGGRARVGRAHFEAAVRPLIARTREPIETCLRETPGRIDHLVMVGGSSRIPAVRRFVADIVGADSSDAVDPMTAVAEGAALAAGILDGSITDLDFWVGTEHALGTLARDPHTEELTFSVLIARNRKYPATAVETYEPVEDYQEFVKVEVVEGDPAKPVDHEDNVVLTEWTIALPERRPKSDAALEITYEYDVDGILRVRVTDSATGTVLIDEHLQQGIGVDPADLARMRSRISAAMP